MLPERNTEDEDAFLLKMTSADSDLIQSAISLALAERRPRLAARLVGLLDDDQLGILEPEDISRARRAASMLLQETKEDRNAWYYEVQQLEELWARGRRRKIEKIKERMRGKNRHPRPRMPRKRR
jgi:hypothetical protein